MGRKCLKCGYERLASDVAPEYECPSCGAIYAKVEAALNKSSSDSDLSDQEKIRAIKEKAAFDKKSEKSTSEELPSSTKNPKLASCKTCGKEVSKTAKSCPHCGEENPIPNESVSIWSVVFAGAFLIWLFSQLLDFGGGSTAKDQSVISDQECKKSLQCWGDKHSVEAEVRCDDVVERMAKYSHEWTDGFVEPKFSRFRWKDESSGVVTYIGDKVRFQNGFGAWQNQVYECDFSPLLSRVIDVRISPGKL